MLDSCLALHWNEGFTAGQRKKNWRLTQRICSDEKKRAATTKKVTFAKRVIGLTAHVSCSQFQKPIRTLWSNTIRTCATRVFGLECSDALATHSHWHVVSTFLTFLRPQFSDAPGTFLSSALYLLTLHPILPHQLHTLLVVLFPFLSPFVLYFLFVILSVCPRGSTWGLSGLSILLLNETMFKHLVYFPKYLRGFPPTAFHSGEHAGAVRIAGCWL